MIDALRAGPFGIGPLEVIILLAFVAIPAWIIFKITKSATSRPSSVSPSAPNVNPSRPDDGESLRDTVGGPSVDSVLPRQSVWLFVFLAVVTLGLYPAFWWLKRLEAFKALSTDKELPHKEPVHGHRSRVGREHSALHCTWFRIGCFSRLAHRHLLHLCRVS